jgi:hypothetical protein
VEAEVIDVEWQDERGACLARYSGIAIDSRLAERAPPDSVCLRFVDAYGDTTFNPSQVARLEHELESLATGVDDVAEQARSLLSFVRQIQERTHRYLKFIGD